MAPMIRIGGTEVVVRPESPLARFLLDIGKAALESEARDRFTKLAPTPAGAMVRAWAKKRTEVKAQGRDGLSDDDWRALLDEAPDIIAAAQARERRDDKP